MKIYTRVYVVQCKTPGYFYVGSTSRLPYLREQEHKDGWGCEWTKKHGFVRTVLMMLVPQPMCKQLEDALTVWLQCRYGYRYVRGGGPHRDMRKEVAKVDAPLLEGSTSD